MRRVILLELNELSPLLMDRFIEEGKLPNFKRMRERSRVFLSEAEERAPYLDPWIQWVNVHTGVPQQEHGISHLSEGHKLKQKCIWELVSNLGAPVWVCGSMSVNYDRRIKGWILPDPWATDVEPHPKDLETFFRFIQLNVQEHTRDRVPVTKADYARFLGFMVNHGLSLGTVSSTLKQLASETCRRGGRWRRAFLMDKFQFDLFSAVYQRIKPRFSTFFLNSTAHMQHAYWRDMQPELFKVPPEPGHQEEYATAILEGYQEMDKIVGRLFNLAGPDTVIILATALSQQPFLDYEATGGKVGYRPLDFAALLAFAGVKAACRVAPVMASQFWIHFENAADAQDALAKLSALHVGERQVLQNRREGNSVFVAGQIFQKIDRGAQLTIADSDQSVPFLQMFYSTGLVKSGMHHPDGILWILDPRQPHAIYPEKVGLISIAPTILDLLGLEKPGYMKGKSLTNAFAISQAA